MTLSTSTAGLTLADFLYSRLSPKSKQKLESDYLSHNPQILPQLDSQKSPTHVRAPKFIRHDADQAKVGQLNLAVSSFRQALNNIVDIKESLFNDIFTKRPVGPPGVEVGSHLGAGVGVEDTPIKDVFHTPQHNHLAFRPSLSDPLRPAVKIISSAPAGGGYPQNEGRFSAPRERTRIDLAVRGQQVSDIQIKPQQSYTGGKHWAGLNTATNVVKGRLVVPVERTPIDIAIFAQDLHLHNPTQTKSFRPVQTRYASDAKEFVKRQSLNQKSSSVKLDPFIILYKSGVGCISTPTHILHLSTYKDLFHN